MKTAGPARTTRTLTEVETSFKDFQKRVDANYREFFPDAPTEAHEKRLRFHEWLARIIGKGKKR